MENAAACPSIHIAPRTGAGREANAVILFSAGSAFAPHAEQPKPQRVQLDKPFGVALVIDLIRLEGDVVDRIQAVG